MPAPAFSSLIALLREAAWLTGDRVRGYGRVLAGVIGVLALFWIGLSQSGLDAAGQPLGTDFLSFWAASKLTLAGTPALAYQPGIHGAVEAAVFAGQDPGYYAFFYPPPFLLVCAPLALMPWGLALPVWLAVTGFGCARVIAAFGDGAPWLAILAFPAVLLTIEHGQNAFLTTALMGGAILAQRRHPGLAGLLFGALIVKPQLGLMIPLYLIAAGAWWTLGAAALTVAGLALVSAALFGPAVWSAFLHATPLARAALEQNLLGAAKMPSAFAAVQLWQGSPALAYAAQLAVAGTAAVALGRAVHQRPQGAAAGPALAAASLLASPFLFDYDLTLLAIPLAWTLAEARRTGFLPWEKIGLLAAFLLPLLARVLALRAGLPLGPPVVAGLLLIVLRRAALDGRRAEAEAGSLALAAT